MDYITLLKNEHDEVVAVLLNDEVALDESDMRYQGEWIAFLKKLTQVTITEEME